MRDYSSSKIPAAPNGIGISLRLMISLGVGLCFIVVLFLYFLNQYSPHQRVNHAPSIHLESGERVMSIIRKIEREPDHPVPTKPDSKTAKRKAAVIEPATFSTSYPPWPTRRKAGLSVHEFKQGSDSAM